MKPRKNKNRGVYVCKAGRVHVMYGDVTLHFDFDEFEKFTLLLDETYHRIKGELRARAERDNCEPDDSSPD